MSMINKDASNFYLDTEFREGPDDNFSVEFFSVGLVNQYGRSFYGVSDKIKDEDHKDHWVYENVIRKLPPQSQRQSLPEIREGLKSVFKGANRTVDIWARNNSYDNFIFCRIFNGMLEMRQTLKKECGIDKINFRDAKELIRLKPATMELSKQHPATEHISVDDAGHERINFMELCGVPAPTMSA